MISVVMAAKNYARFLPMAVRSVQTQTLTDWELVIVDDGSSDATPQAVTPFLNDERIRYFRSDSLGQSRAKNLGVRLSRGELVAFLDADDAWLPTKLERQLPLLKGNVGVVACERILIDENRIDLQSTDRKQEVNPLPSVGALQKFSRDDIFTRNPVCFSSVLVRNEVFDRVGGFDPDLDLSIDYDLWLRVAQHYDIVCLNEKLVLYRTGHGNLSKRQADRIATAFTIMHRRRDGVSESALAAGYGSTHQSLAWMQRGAEPWSAMKSYAKSLAWPGHRMSSLKGMAGVLVNRLRGLAEPLSPENRSINC